MTVEIKGDNIKITLTKEELKGLRPGLPYELTSIIGEAESDHDGYAHKVRPQAPEVHTSRGHPTGSFSNPLAQVVRTNYRFANPVIDSIVRNQLEKGINSLTVTGDQIVMGVK